MKSLCVITIKLNTLTDVPYQMTVGGAFVYVCERGHVKDFERSRVYNALQWSRSVYHSTDLLYDFYSTGHLFDNEVLQSTYSSY